MIAFEFNNTYIFTKLSRNVCLINTHILKLYMPEVTASYGEPTNFIAFLVFPHIIDDHSCLKVVYPTNFRRQYTGWSIKNRGQVRWLYSCAVSSEFGRFKTFYHVTRVKSSSTSSNKLHQTFTSFPTCPIFKPIQFIKTYANDKNFVTLLPHFTYAKVRNTRLQKCILLKWLCGTPFVSFIDDTNLKIKFLFRTLLEMVAYLHVSVIFKKERNNRTNITIK